MILLGIIVSCLSGALFAVGAVYMRLASKSRKSRLGTLKYTPEGKMIKRGPVSDYERTKVLLALLYWSLAIFDLLIAMIYLR